MAAAARKPTKVLGVGSYGRVFSPAAPNVTDDGSEMEFPGEVTKLFLDKKVYDKSIALSRKMVELFGAEEDGYRIRPYRKIYRVRDVDPVVLAGLMPQVEADSQDVPNVPMEQIMDMPVYMVHMPYLGIELNTYIHDPVAAMNLRRNPACVPLQIVRQILRLVKTVERFVQAGVIHADVRDTNVLIHPETGVMTIIDYDMMLPMKEGYDTYQPHFGYYSNPPESLIIPALKEIPNVVLYDQGEWKDLLQPVSMVYLPPKVALYIRQSYDTFRPFWDAVGGGSLENFAQFIQRALLGNAADLAPLLTDRTDAGAYEVFRKVIGPTFDSFGLGLSLLSFLVMMYPGILTDTREDFEAVDRTTASTHAVPPLSKPERSLLQDTGRALYLLCHLMIRTRIHPSNAVTLIEQALQRFSSVPQSSQVPLSGPQVPLSGPQVPLSGPQVPLSGPQVPSVSGQGPSPLGPSGPQVPSVSGQGPSPLGPSGPQVSHVPSVSVSGQGPSVLPKPLGPVYGSVMRPGAKGVMGAKNMIKAMTAKKGGKRRGNRGRPTSTKRILRATKHTKRKKA